MSIPLQITRPARAAILYGSVRLFLVALGIAPATVSAQGQIINHPITVQGKQWDFVVEVVKRPAGQKGIFLNGMPVTFDSAQRGTVDVPGAGSVEFRKKGSNLEVSVGGTRLAFTTMSRDLDIKLLSPSPLTDATENLKTQLSNLKMKLHDLSTAQPDSAAAIERRVQSRLDSVQTLIGAITSDVNAPR